MKIKEGFELREVCGEYVVMAYGKENIDFSKIISLNETAACMWRAAENGEFTSQTLADALCNEYEVEAEAALADAQQMMQEWEEQGLIEA